MVDAFERTCDGTNPNGVWDTESRVNASLKKLDTSTLNSNETSPLLEGAGEEGLMRAIEDCDTNSSLVSMDSSILTTLVASEIETWGCFPRLSFGQKNLIYPLTLPSTGRLKKCDLCNPNVPIQSRKGLREASWLVATFPPHMIPGVNVDKPSRAIGHRGFDGTKAALSCAACEEWNEYEWLVEEELGCDAVGIPG